METTFADRKGGFPHSEICGSKGARASPQLIAACHVLHRLPAPRHPSEALMRLIVLSKTHARGRSRQSEDRRPFVHAWALLPDNVFSSRSALQGLGVPGKSFFYDVKSTRSPKTDVKSVLSPIARFGGARRDRTDDLMLAKHALYQLSYGPKLGSPIRSVVVDRGPSPWRRAW